MRKALYRKYRSRSLGEIVGQEHITKVLESSLRDGKVSHAYLFVGPRGTGKTSVARILAHAVNSFDYEIEDSYLDIIEIDAASNTGVDNIRDLREKAMIAPAAGKYKVYIIDEVHMLSKSAFNALLKTLEEPPEHVIFIMATTDAHKVPVTIVSRAQKFVFRLADEETMRGHLRKVAEAEKIDIDDGGLGVIARRSGGSFRDAMSLLDQIATVSDGKITAEVIGGVLGLPGEEKVAQLLAAYTEADAEKLVQVLRGLAEEGVRAELVAEELVGRIVREPRRELLPLLDRLTGVAGGFAEVRLMLALLGGGSEASGSGGISRDRVSGREVSTAVSSSSGRDERSAWGDIPMSGYRAGGDPVTPVAPSPSSAQVNDEKTESSTSPKTPSVTKHATVDNGDGSTRQAKDFNWEAVVEGVRVESAGLGAHLSKLQCDVCADKVTVYAKTKFIKTIVDKGRGMIVSRMPEGVELEVIAGMKPQGGKWDKISAIMGGAEEVELDG